MLGYPVSAMRVSFPPSERASFRRQASLSLLQHAQPIYDCIAHAEQVP